MKLTKITSFQVIHFPMGEDNHPILVYALADDGILYELNGGTWIPFPINKSTIKAPTPPLPPSSPSPPPASSPSSA